MRPASSASFAAVRRLARRETLRNLSSLMIFRALPQDVEVLEAAPGERRRAAARHPLHRREALAELRVGSAQRSFGIDAEPASEIDDREEHVAELFAYMRGLAAVDGDVELADFLVELVDDAFGARPVEADRRRFLLDALRSEQRRQALRDAVQERL